MTRALQSFHPAVAGWFSGCFERPTEPQLEAWPSIREGLHTLIAAPTGSGKTLAAFLAAIDELVRRSSAGPLPDAVQVVYVSPLKALSNDIRRNLEGPLAGIERELASRDLPPSGIRTLVRTGDTPASERGAMTKKPPHILVTTPESLYIMLTSDGGRGILRTARTVIVDEIHAVADDKRGSHLSLSLERLDALVRASGEPPVRIGLSATQRPIETVARFLTGCGRRGDPPPPCNIVDSGHRRDLDLGLELPRSPLEAVLSAEVWSEIYDRLAELIQRHRTTLIFVNTRRLAERATRQLSQRIGEDLVTSHHGSLAREQRFTAERRLKGGELRALVATASLELGIDIGSVDLVCNIGSTRSIATLLQRVGRSGHTLGRTPKGRIFPTSRDELVECAALLDAVRRGELERLAIPEQPLDVLAQQIVAAVACAEWSEDDLYDLVRRAYPFGKLPRESFDAVVRMLAEGFSTRRGRRGALVHHDLVHGRLRPRRGARLAAITSGGAIPDNADYRVVLQPSGSFIGTLDEDFAIESIPGDIFQLGNSSWRIQRIDQGRVLVEDARGEPPNIPFWLGEAPGRTEEASQAVSRLRVEATERLERSQEDGERWLAEEVGTGPVAARQIADYLASARAALGTMPSRRTLVLERFFDEAGNQHLVIHSPFGSRLNRAWGLALRKRFCRSFNFELQAAATEDAILLSLGPTHSFEANATFRFLHSSSVRSVLTQALLDAPMFPIRWRWNASRSLALLRFRGGRKVPPRLQRMQAEDLIAVVFPDQLACLENISGEREIPDHPLVDQTIRDCLEEAMDIARLEELLREIEGGREELVARELREPSPLAHEILNAKPYAFLDDAPLEERRTRAVFTRSWLDPETAADLGRLDAEAIERVRREVRPEPTTADELHDALVTFGFLTEEEGRAMGRPLFESLIDDGRAAVLHGGDGLWIAAERVGPLRSVHPEARFEPAIEPPRRVAGESWTAESALEEILRGRLAGCGPVTVHALATTAAVDPRAVERALATLEAQGFVMRGRFTPGAEDEEWCERRLLARIHRYTLDRLRREIEPVSPTDFMRFLFAWQRVEPEERGDGAEALAAVLEQLEGFEAPAGGWEGELFPARLREYDPLWLDALCLSGRIVWGRVRRADNGGTRRARPILATPIVLLPREKLGFWGGARASGTDERLSHSARTVADHLRRRGACFFNEIKQGTGLLRTQLEEGLAELVADGRATAVFGMENAGRWSLMPEPDSDDGADRVEPVALALLRRYGVVFRRLLDRESLLVPWRDLLRCYRRLEARGEIRGGRFVDGFSGEQFALAEAVGRLRSIRREEPNGVAFSVSAADPVNLAGIVTPGARVPSIATNRILYRDGRSIATFVAGEVSFLVEMGAAEQWEARGALLRRRVPPRLRAYLGRPA